MSSLIFNIKIFLILFCSIQQSLQYNANIQIEHEDDDNDDIIPKHGKCIPITVPFCTNMAYNTTIMPNILGHSTQEEAGQDIHQFYPLIKVNCSQDLQLFLCSVFIPVCTILETPVPPCRSLCLSAKNGCEQLMMEFSYSWPTSLDCDNYPDKSPLCIGRTDNAIQATTAVTEYKKIRPKYPRDYGFVCPIQFQVKDTDYSLKVGNKVERNCGAPCHMMFFNENRRQFSRIWIGTWSLLCLVSCLFTVCTYLIDTDRFRYPERPIIFLSVCYLMVAFAYLIGFIAGDSIACKEPSTNLNDGIRRVSTITQGTKYEMCTILFMMLYFFNMSSSIWWVILTLTWFLAAGLKWGHEAIEANSQYFHLAAWALPAIKTITILAMGKVDGDILSGVCYVGIWNVETMRIFVLTPLCIYLIFGMVFLISGFVSLFRIRTVMKHDGTKTDKLEKLMIRIGVFSVLYMVPAIVIIICLFYEHFNFDDWMMTWNRDMCYDPFYSVPCPQDLQKIKRPLFEIFMIKYLMYMIVGITSSVWIWSSKTVHSWRVFFNRLQGGQAAYV